MKISHFPNAAAYAFKTFVLRKKLPYLVGIVITDHCNLKCYYCNCSGRFHFSYQQAKDALDNAYRRGNRTLYFTGGEPLIWKDEDYDLSSLIRYAKNLGFQEIFVFTNGTKPLSIPECSYIVTIDGPERIHNKIRSDTYQLIINNVKHAITKNVFASITITKTNASFLNEYIKEVCSLNLFYGISFNFLTKTTEEVAKLGFLPDERKEILDKLWNIKKSGFPIVLSRAAYHAMVKNDWKRPINQIELCTPEATFTCCRDVVNPDVCANCGYTNCVEVSQILDLRPSAIMQVLKMT